MLLALVVALALIVLVTYIVRVAVMVLIDHTDDQHATIATIRAQLANLDQQ